MEHAIDSFQEGETVILTLKDKGGLNWGALAGATGTAELRASVTGHCFCPGSRSAAGGGGCAGEREPGG